VPSRPGTALALFATTSDDGEVTGMRVVSRPEFTVSGDQRLDLRADEADSRITVDTPRPALSQEGGFVYRWAAKAGPSLYLDMGRAAARRGRRLGVGIHAGRSMTSAACPSCRLLVVEADSRAFADMAATEDSAVRLGATAVSNS
jgi:hypothetical protein